MKILVAKHVSVFYVGTRRMVEKKNVFICLKEQNFICVFQKTYISSILRFQITIVYLLGTFIKKK